jgi:hypothetical protein
MVSMNREDIKRISLDLLLPAGTVAVLVLVHLLVPLRMRSAMAFNPDLFSVYSLLTAAYVHADTLHLAENAGVFVLTAPFAYLLALFLGIRRWFHLTAIGLLLVLPVVNNLVVYLVVVVADPTATVAQFGFSPVGAGFAAFLLSGLLAYAQNGYGRLGATLLLAFLTILATVVFGLSSLANASTVGIGMALTSFVLGVGWYQCRQFRLLRGSPRADSPVPTDATVLAVGLFVFSLEFFSLFQLGHEPARLTLTHALPFAIGAGISGATYWGLTHFRGDGSSDGSDPGGS